MPTDRDEAILQRLGAWKQKDGSLPPVIELYSQLLLLQVAVKSWLSVPDHPHLTQETVRFRMQKGLPLLEFKDFCFDWDRVKRSLRGIVDVLEGGGWEGFEGTGSLRDIASNEPWLRQVVGDWFEGLTPVSVAAEHCVDEDVLSLAVQAAVQPFLLVHSEAVWPLVDQKIWRRRRCPVCGGSPDLAYVEAGTGARWLLCSRCDAVWLFQRIQCPFCDTRNQESLGYLADDTEVYRLYTCDNCLSYIKAVDLRKAGGEVLLPLERVMTLDMDRQALEAGYHPGRE